MTTTAEKQSSTAATSADAPLLRIRRINPAALLSSYTTAGAAGLDLAACLPEGERVLQPGEISLIPCGFAMAIPCGYEGQVRPRSGLATRHGVTLINAPGTIDSDYRGEAMVPLVNHGQEPFTIRHADRIAQMVIAPVARAEVVEVETLDDTDRGHGGFGSTGL
jgi:dUTP pyrophosphatase